MSRSAPWIMFSAAWTSRTKGPKLLGELEQFIQSCAMAPAPEVELSMYEDLGREFESATRDVEATPEATARALESFGYRPGPLVDEATRRFGTGLHHRWASGECGFRFAWRWSRSRSESLAALADFYQENAELTVADDDGRSRPAVDLMVSYWFDAKRPGERAPLFASQEVRSSLTAWLGSRRVSLALRYPTAKYDPDLAAAHAEILASLGPKSPRGVLDRITPSSRPGARERRERLA